MLHPSYTDLMETINSETEGDTPVVNSRYSIVLATAKRARQLIAGEEAYVNAKGKKPLSIAVEAVSYTHLDVYKRQDCRYGYALCRAGVQGSVQRRTDRSVHIEQGRRFYI